MDCGLSSPAFVSVTDLPGASGGDRQVSPVGVTSRPFPWVERHSVDRRPSRRVEHLFVGSSDSFLVSFVFPSSFYLLSPIAPLF